MRNSLDEPLRAVAWKERILTGAVVDRAKDIALDYDIVIEEVEVSRDHIYIFCSFPPRLSSSQVITCFKSLSARAIFKEFPMIKRQLWGGEFWEDGYFARTVGDKVTAEVIKKHIQRHQEQKDALQLDLF